MMTQSSSLLNAYLLFKLGGCMVGRLRGEVGGEGRRWNENEVHPPPPPPYRTLRDNEGKQIQSPPSLVLLLDLH